jgi:parallel beta-helix repeat protein
MGNSGSGSPTVTNCIFSGNSVYSLEDAYGGGMYIANNSSPTVTNCTFSGNLADSDNTYGGGIYYAGSSSTTVTNCILWGDSPSEIFKWTSLTLNITYSDIQGSYPGTGNIDADPLFVDSAGGDYHLQDGSPCIDMGDNSAPELPEKDIDGDDRIIDGNDDGSAVVDMGADEYKVRGGIYSAVANAEASNYGGGSLTASGSFNSLALLLIPVGAVLALKTWRRKR